MDEYMTEAEELEWLTSVIHSALECFECGLIEEGVILLKGAVEDVDSIEWEFPE